MKAWEVTTDYADCSDVVFANSRNDARKKLVNGETVLDSTLANDDSVEYIEVRATRLPKLDGMEKEAEANWILAESRIRGTEMAHLKYYEASVDNDNFAIVEAASSGKAKYKYIQGDVIPYFQGYDNSEIPFTDIRVIRRKKLDRFDPDDDFNILKTLINEYGWEFTDGFATCLYADNYSDENLRHYIKYGEIDNQED